MSRVTRQGSSQHFPPGRKSCVRANLFCDVIVDTVAKVMLFSIGTPTSTALRTLANESGCSLYFDYS